MTTHSPASDARITDEMVVVAVDAFLAEPPGIAPNEWQWRRPQMYAALTAALALPTPKPSPVQGGAEMEKLRAENTRLRSVLEEKGSFDIWRDGYRAALAVAESVKMHVSWGPKAAPDHGLGMGLEAVKSAVRRSADKIAASTPTPETDPALLAARLREDADWLVLRSADPDHEVIVRMREAANALSAQGGDR